MNKLKRHRIKTEEEIDVNMVPVMNMFLVLIPFLLMSASFLHLKAINTSVPVIGESSPDKSKPKNVKVTVIAQIKEGGIHLSANSDSLRHDEINKWEAIINRAGEGEYPFSQMASYLQGLKDNYPASDTIIIIPDAEIVYDTLIQAMDAARYTHEKRPLFPNVVLSGKV